MAPAYPKLTTPLQQAGTDGYLLDADGEIRLLVPDMVYPRATTESDADTVRRFSAFDYGSKVVEHGPARAGPLVTAAFLAEYGVDSVSVPASFPNGTADVLRDHGIDVVTDYDDAVGRVRAVKSDAEVEAIRATQRSNERGMAVAEELLETASVEDGHLYLDGEPLTSERIRRAIDDELREHGCRMDECIVASGPESAKAHFAGTGPIAAGEPVIVDVAPRDTKSRYYADMTRTFVKGDPPKQVEAWYDLTREAYDTALEMLRPGVTGEAVNDAVCDVFEREGYPTLRTNESTEDGFTSSTGHGVGLDVHEQPKLSWGGAELAPGHVVTVEPGLYEQGTGGVRLEDLVVVTETGYENLTEYPRDLRVV